MLSILGELIFTIAIGYMGAIELLFMLKHLYHWSCQHHRRMVMLHERGDEESLKELQEHIQKSINEAAKDEIPGYQRMKDGIFYKDGFRVNLNSENKITTEEQQNQSIKREIIGSSENRIDKNEAEIPDIVNVNINAEDENKNIIEDTTKFKDHEENLQIQEELNIKNDYGLNESTSNKNRNIEVQEDIIIKEQVPLINSGIIPPQQTERNYSVEFDESQIDIPDQDDKNERINLIQTVKTQIGQTNIEQYSLKSPSRIKIGKSDDSSSIEPWSSQKSSSLSTQQSSSLETAMSVPEMHFDEYERQAPDGEDVPSEQHYSDEYLRSLDGIKNRPLIRDDGSGRRRAFKKRRSSGDSNSSRESRHSREEELKMFTSLEEEEFATMKKGSDGTGGEFTPIRYSSDPNLKVNKPHRRRKRSPVQDPNSIEKLGSNSLEMLNEEDTNPWGDVKPEHYKDTEFWKREKSNSIPEELEETGISEREQDSDNAIDENITRNVSTLSTGKNIPKMSSFEEATHSQHEKVISILKNQGSKDANEPPQDDAKPEYDDKSDETENVSIDETYAQVSQTLADQIAFASAFDENKTPQETEEVACSQPYDHSESHSTGSGLRRSPRMDEIDHYEERWEQEERRKSSSLTPSDHQSDELDTAGNPNSLSLDIKRKLIERSPTPEKIEIKITYEPLIERKDKITIEKPSTPTIEVDFAPDEDSDNRKVNLHIEEDTVDDYDDDIEEEIPLDTMAGLSDFYDFNASINPPRTRSNSMRRSKSAEPLSTSPIDFRSKSPAKQEIEKINITNEPLIEHKDMTAIEKPSTPTIEIDFAPDENVDDRNVNLHIEGDTVDDYYEDIEQEIPLDPMAGLSDFYDFNASINPPRSPSSSMRRSKSSAPLSKSPIDLRSKSPATQEPNNFVKTSPSPSSTDSQPKTQNISYLSDFYDFNVNLNQQAYNRPIEKSNQDTNRDSIAMMIEDLQNLQSEYKLENLENLESDTEITLQIDRLKNDLIELRGIPIRPITPNNLSPTTPETPEYPSNLTEITLQIPDYPRSFSTELNHVERLKDEMIASGFKRSQYVGESTDFSDDYEELREQIKKFRRSLSKSRSPISTYDELGVQMNRNTVKKELQERILEEITKTTVDFQDFSRDLRQDFLEYERRVSDSALIIQKPEILIQFEDELDGLEPEEYHHFRRFSIQQDYQVEEYPVDDIIYVDQIEVTTADGATETWQRDDTYTSEDKCVFNQMEVVISDDIDTYTDKASSNEMEEIILDDIHPSEDKDNYETEISDDAYTSGNKHVINEINTIDLNYSSADKCGYSHIKEDVSHDSNTSEDKDPSSNVAEVESVLEELEEENHNNGIDELHETDSNSSDDRQTIVEVDDGIDVDVLDYNDRTEDSYNEQSECEEFDNTIDRYANRTASDWKEEGAVGGIIDEEFDQMYDEAIKDRKPSGIQRDYDGIVENISDDKIMDYDDSISIRTEDLLEEILNADEEKYGWSTRISRASSKESNRSLLDGSEHRYLANAVSQSISSTRLRSRYGLAPATGSYANFENTEDIDINYKPKKEYNWRKNFKLDDDDKNNNNSSENSNNYKQSWNNLDVYDDTGKLLDSRKYSLGGESVTLFSRSPGNSENGDDLENVPEENFNDYQNNESFFREENQKHHEEYTEKIEKENIKTSVDPNTTEDQLEEIEKIPKKKKSKKKLRKGSKGSLGNDDENSQSRRESLFDTEVPDNLEEAPKIKKKKKKVKESTSIEEHIVSEKIDVAFNENKKSLNNPPEKIMESSIENSFLITHNPLENTIKSQNPESKISAEPQVSTKNETESISVESITPKSIESINSTSHSISASSDSSEKSQKLDKIESSDIIELIRDSSILGSSF